MKKEIKIKRRKEKIMSLAENAKVKIIQNRLLLEHIGNYNKQIQMIKLFMDNYSEKFKLVKKNSKENINRSNFIKSEFKIYYVKLKNAVSKLREATNKIQQKYESNANIYFDDLYGNKINYNQSQLDTFILSNSLKLKLNIIKRLKQSIHSSKDYNIFQEPKRETLVPPRNIEYDIDYMHQDLQKYSLYESI